MLCRSILCKKICYFYDVHKEYVDMENQKKINLKLINLSQLTKLINLSQLTKLVKLVKLSQLTKLIKLVKLSQLT